MILYLKLLYSLRTKFIVTFLLVALIPVGILAWLNHQATEAALINAANQTLSSAASKTSTVINSFILSNLSEVDTLTHLPELIAHLSIPARERLGASKMVDTLTNLKNTDPNIISQAILDENGIVIITRGQNLDLGTDQSAERFFQEPFLTGQPYVSEVRFVNDKAVIYFSSPIKDILGNIIGVFVWVQDATILQTLIYDSALQNSDASVMLLDEHHRLLAYNSNPNAVFKFLTLPDEAQLAELQAEHLIPSQAIPSELSLNLPHLEQELFDSNNTDFTINQLTTNNQAYQAVVERVPSTAWRVVYFQPRHIFLAPVQAQTTRNLFVVLSIAVIVVFAAGGATQLLVGPILRLTEVAKTIIAGNLRARAVVESKDEIGTLAKTFNQMTSQLDQSINQLEQRVSDRTHELEVSLQETESLFQAAQGILGASKLETICDKLIFHFNNIVKSDHMALYLVSHAKKQVIHRAGDGDSTIWQTISYDLLNEGISGKVFRTGQPILSRHADDGLEPESTRERRKQVGIGSLIVAPFVTNGKVIGTITAANKLESRMLTEHDMELLMTLTTQAASAIQNIRLFEQEQAQRRISDSLREVALVLNQSLEREVVIDKILKQLQLVIECDGCGLFILEEESMVLVGGSELNQPYIGRRSPLSDDNFEQTSIRTKQPHVIADVHELPNYDQYWEGDSRIRSWMSVPLLIETKILGILTIDSFQVGAYDEDETRVAQIFASQAAVAIQNARLYAALAQLNADKDRFFSIVAHDLKGPFMPLLGSSELLIDMAGSFSTAEIQEMGRGIHRSAKNVFNLLENLLQWSRLQQGHLAYNPEAVLLSEIAITNVELLKENARSKEVRLYAEVPESIIVVADPYMLDTVIRNLTSNALKFTPADGEVCITATPQNDKFIQVSVVDTGVGMSDKVKKKLFQTGEHVTTLGTAKEQGTGLGLIICQEMVIKWGGRIWVESELGQGTTVSFTVQGQP